MTRFRKGKMGLIALYYKNSVPYKRTRPRVAYHTPKGGTSYMEKNGNEMTVDCPLCTREFLEEMGFSATQEGLISAGVHDPNKASCKKCRKVRNRGCKW